MDELEVRKKKLKKYEAFENALRELFGITTAAPTQKQRQGQKIKLKASLTEITLEDKAPKIINMTTEKTTGKLMFCALKLHQEDSVFTSAELQKEARQYGWNIGNKALGGSMMVMVREGQLIQDGKKYSLPSKVKINVKETTGK